MNGKILVSRYEILEKYQEGGMSNIYLARDKKFDGTCIVKELKRNTGDQQEIERFLREGGLLYWLKHARLPRVFDIFIENEKYYIVMDYIEGDNLQSILMKDEKISQEKVLNWSCQILEILIYLHSKNIIFRDLKPSNIILDSDDKINLIDFGISRRVFSEQEILSDQTRIGTPQYAPDEQYEGKSDPRSDIFALGLVMTELLTGQAPRIRFIPKLSPEKFHPELIKIVEKALDQEPEKRYQTAEEMLCEVKNFIDGKLFSITDITNVLDEIRHIDEPNHVYGKFNQFLKGEMIYDKIERARQFENRKLFNECNQEIISAYSVLYNHGFTEKSAENYLKYLIKGMFDEYLGKLGDASYNYKEACDQNKDGFLAYQGLERVKEKIEFDKIQAQEKRDNFFSKIINWIINPI